MRSRSSYATGRIRPIVTGLAVVIVSVLAMGVAALVTWPDSGALAAGDVAGDRPRPDKARPAARATTAALVPDRTLPSSAPVAGGPGVQVTPPQLLAISPATVPARTLRKIAKLPHVQKVAVTDGGAVHVSGTALRLLAVDPAQFRSWTPKRVAEHPEVWSGLARGELVADSGTIKRLGVRLGVDYQIDGGPRLRVAASASLGLPDIDGLVSQEVGRRLGFPAGVVVLVHGDPGKVDRDAVARLLGKGAQVVRIGPESERPKAATPQGQALVGRPESYLDLYQRSATVCPGLSWTVLAAIGQVESSHGRNNGPSSAGALGPMQFMPATWKSYGVDGDGDGEADIWSPYDAVPSAAKYLCANGAGAGGEKLRKSVWFYNHSWDYVNKVLSLADAYARSYAS
ncbi:lytic transglycosylase domain-containing protein [Microbispora sp. H10885]|uniref:lytic transglycosylase domain-containing protein n=1 Tax=Microbispora sp. H10885 TaxID=2729110 RepID=UPI002873350E|nr:lytic transglycosylase domain-containing protein [Microbispora sp. H10885]